MNNQIPSHRSIEAVDAAIGAVRTGEVDDVALRYARDRDLIGVAATLEAFRDAKEKRTAQERADNRLIYRFAREILPSAEDHYPVSCSERSHKLLPPHTIFPVEDLDALNSLRANTLWIHAPGKRKTLLPTFVIGQRRLDQRETELLVMTPERAVFYHYERHTKTKKPEDSQLMRFRIKTRHAERLMSEMSRRFIQCLSEVDGTGLGLYELDRAMKTKRWPQTGGDVLQYNARRRSGRRIKPAVVTLRSLGVEDPIETYEVPNHMVELAPRFGKKEEGLALLEAYKAGFPDKNNH